MINEVTSHKMILPKYFYVDIILRLINKEDLKETLKWRNYYCNWFIDSKTIDFDKHLKWFEQYQLKQNDFVFIIEDEYKQKLGQIAIYNINWQEKSAELGRVVVNPSFTGYGYMQKACKAVMLLSADVLNLNLLSLEVKANNKRAIKLYEKCGFALDKKNNELMYYKASL